MIDKVVRNLLLTFFLCKMTKIINFLTTILVKKKKMCYNVSKLREKKKGNAEMSRLLQEMIGKEPIITGVYIGPDNWEVVDVDEEWVKLRSVDKKGKEKFKLQRIEDIQTVEFDGE
ncbi:hypothetical protein ACREYU_07900 [Streptococcus pneumoniae]|uniref:hypothetical protein n=1 Tax=Streptococcus pneumoniae TaxID=1313 RepID=UPI000419CEC2|nr:hypothetical protein [Streptococcus pneumoniae]OYL09706.1 hypothetical protein AK84_03825 [Streptococcus pneumoniae K2557]KXW26706.1 aspartyl-tRNA synthetase [Streptococcus pneumoniae]MBM4660165.1 hypothetical protein [Streptococcus pneumoniae]MBS0668100.1 hypothetical protein [Streptococcus pneumoniae]MBS0677933.1 hypothetical protein [Streptococcus pneumoniae]